jgi:NAD(P)-dependent dehydrogenase (short-subunit alcohol dehydrogenase family)
MTLLDGIRVVEMGLWLAGPATGGILSDWGAEVIKIEPIGGDPMRNLYGHLSGSKESRTPAFDQHNRGKRSVALDIKAERGRELADLIVGSADVFLTNMRPAFLRRVGLDHDRQLSLNPRLVYAILTGYGLEGPDRDAPGFDVAAFSARSGVAYRSSPEGEPPPTLPGGFGDTVTAMTTAAADIEPWPGHRRPRMHNHVVFVTGGTRGIGAAISRSFAEQGAIVAAGYGRDLKYAEELKADLERHGAQASIHQGNVGSSDDCRRTIAEVIEQHGRLDVLVNNAGITIDKTVLKLTDEDWYKVIAVNLSGAFFMSQAVLPHMIERGSGRIINISSIIGRTGNIGQSNYAASKSGLFGLTMSLAREAAFQLQRAGKLGQDSIGVTVNAVAPGFIATEMLEHIPEKVLNRIKAQIPVGRLGRPDEIARVVHFLASDQSSFITGAVWDVNGGQDM